MRKLKLYLETSVWNFCFAEDAPEKQAATLQFFEQVKHGAYDIFVSDVVFREIANASGTRKQLLLQLLTECQHEELEINEAVLQLTSQYLTQGALPMTAKADATHAAVATVYELDALISWNLKHLANLKRMEKINGVNLIAGYAKKLELVTPLEVINDE
jgi:predicted nucleic acid-binding protein